MKSMHDQVCQRLVQQLSASYQGIFARIPKRTWLRVAPLVALCFATAGTQVAQAASGTWNGSNSGTWTTAGNWTGSVPNGATDTATFSSNTGSTTIDLGGTITIASIVFDTSSCAAYTFNAGANKFILAGSGNITLGSTVTQNQLFNAPIQLGGDRTAATYNFVNNSTSASLTFAGYVGGTTTGGTTPGNKILAVSGAGNITISGTIFTSGASSLALTKSGAGTLTLSGADTYAGGTTISGGTLKLTGASGAVNSSGSITITSATLLLDNTSAANNTDRLKNTGTVTMNGGTFLFSNNAGAVNYSESAGTLSIATGLNTVSASQAASLQTSALTFAALIRASGAFVNFTGTSLGADTRNQILFTAAPTLGAWATVNGTDFAAYGANGITTAYADVNHGGSINAGATTNVRINGGTSGNITLNFSTTGSISTLFQNTGTAGTVATAGKTLQTSGMMIGSTMGSLTIGAAANDGTLMSNAPGGDLILINNSANYLTINAVIADNTSASSLIKVGTGGLTLAGANNYTGSTFINSGTLQVNTGSNLGATTAVVTMGTGSAGVLGTVGNLTLNTDTTIGKLTVQSNTSTITGSANINQLTIASDKTLTIGGTLTVGLAGNATAATKTALATGSTPGAGGTLTVNGNVSIGLAVTADPPGSSIPATVVDLSGLSNFNVTSTGTGYFRVGYGQQDKATLTLANNNTINGGTITIGDGAGANYNLPGFSTMNLGSGANYLQSPNIVIGQGKGAGILQFATITGSVTITGANGSGTANITVGNANIGNVTYQGTGVSSLLLAGHTANVNAGTVTVGSINAGFGNDLFAAVTFDTGTFTANSIELAAITGGSKNSTGTFTLGSNGTSTGVLTVSGGHFYLAKNTVAGRTATGSLIINGGFANIYTAITDASTAGTSTTTLTLAGGTLDMNNNAIGGNASGNRAIGTLNFQAGTLKNVSEINAGTTGLTKTTAGRLTLDGSNTYSGKTTVQNGTLAFTIGNVSDTGSQSLGQNGTLDLGVALTSSGVLQYTGSGAATLAKNINVLGNGSDTIQNGGTGLLTLSGALTKTGTTLTLKGGAQGITVTGVIQGNNGSFNSDLVIDGGLTTLLNANTYEGPTFLINGATLNANVADALPTANGRTAVIMDQTGAGNSTLALGADQFIATLTGASSSSVNLAANKLTIGAASGSATFAGIITGLGGQLVKDDASTQVLAGANSYTGLTEVQAGELDLNTTGNNALAGDLTVAGGTAKLLQADQIANTSIVTISGGILDLGIYTDTVGAFNLTSGALNGSGTITASTYGLSGGTVNANLGAGTVTVSTGTTVLNGTAAGSPVVINSGTLALGASDRLADSATVIVAGGVLDIGSYKDTVAGVTLASGSINGAGGSLTSTSTFDIRSGSVSAILDGSVGLTKSTGGTAVLTGNNTYIGATLINGGTLALSGSGSIINSVLIDVAASATFDVSGVSGYTLGTGQTLQGNGTVVGPVTAMGTVAPGNGVGTLTFSADFTLANNGTLSLELSGNNMDQIVVGGNLTLTGTINFAATGTQTNPAYVFATYGGSLNHAGVTVTGLPSGYTVNWAYAANEAAIVIPEPSALLLVGVGLVGLMLTSRWFRRRNA